MKCKWIYILDGFGFGAITMAWICDYNNSQLPYLQLFF